MPWNQINAIFKYNCCTVSPLPMCNHLLALYYLFPLFLCSSQQMGLSPHPPPPTHTPPPPTWQQQPVMVKWLTLLMSAKNCSDNSLMERRKYIQTLVSSRFIFGGNCHNRSWGGVWVHPFMLLPPLVTAHKKRVSLATSTNGSMG